MGNALIDFFGWIPSGYAFLFMSLFSIVIAVSLLRVVVAILSFIRMLKGLFWV